jgi:hypothetical protein
VENSSHVIPLTVSPLEGLVMRLMVGYMLYDMVIELVTPEKLDKLVLVHHVLGLIQHGTTLAHDDGVSAFFTMGVYVAEASTPLLHLSWMLYKIKLGDALIFKATTLLLFLIFFLCRVVLSPILLYQLLTHAYLYRDAGRDGMLAFQVVILVAFVLLNYFWFYKLLEVVILKKPVSEGKKAKKSNKDA